MKIAQPIIKASRGQELKARTWSVEQKQRSRRRAANGLPSPVHFLIHLRTTSPVVAPAPSTVGCCLPHQPSAKTCLWSNLMKAILRFPFTPGCFQVVDSQNCSLAVSARFAPFLQESISNQILSIVRHCHPVSPRSVQPSPLILCLVLTL